MLTCKKSQQWQVERWPSFTKGVGAGRQVRVCSSVVSAGVSRVRTSHVAALPNRRTGSPLVTVSEIHLSHADGSAAMVQ